MSTTITKLQQSDKAQWQALYRAYAEFYKVPMTDDILNTVWTWLQDENTNLHALAARTANNTLIGIAHYRQEYSPLRAKKVGFLDDLYVVPAHRGSGITQQIFAALKAEAQKHGWHFIRWRTAEDNYRARAAYDKIAEKTHWQTYQMNITE